MQLPLTEPETLFAELWQDLPAESVQMARAFKAFVRAKKVKTPAPLLRVVFFYCGLDKPLREVAGTLTAVYESMTDQSRAERWRAWGPWVPSDAPTDVPHGRCGAPARGAGCRPIVCTWSQPIVPGPNAGRDIQKARRVRRASFWQAGSWCLPRWRRRCSPPRRSWPCTGGVGQWKSP